MAKSVIDFTEAEKKARRRDNQVENEKLKKEYNGVDPEDVKNALRILNKATESEDGNPTYYLGKTKKRKNNILFAQLIQDNWNYAVSNNYFTAEEMKFLFRIIGLLQFKTNCIVDNIHSSSPTPLNQTQLADKLGSSKQTIGRLISSLMDKGIIIKAFGSNIINAKNQRNYCLFVNPNIICSGDKDKIEETLKIMFSQSKKTLKDFPIALF